MKNKLNIVFSVFFIFFSLVVLTSFSLAESKTDSITIGLGGQEPHTLYPTSSFAANKFISHNVFEALVTFSADGKLIPSLATSWSFSPDGKILEFKLRRDVKFSSGDPFTAQDFIFSLEENRKENPPIAEQLSGNFIKIEAVDDYTVRFYMKQLDITYLYNTAAQVLIISKSNYDKVGKDAYMKNPVGTGPYKFAGWKTKQYIDMVINDNYWGKKPVIKKAHYIIASEPSTRVNMLKTGEVDMITETPWQQVSELQKLGYRRTDIFMPQTVAFVFDLMNPDVPWANIKVRKAINYAIDKDGIINKILNNVPVRIGWLYQHELGYDASLKPSYPYDIEKAKKLMIEAGYSNGFEMPVYFLTDMPGVKEITEYISISLKQLKINCKLIGMTLGPEFIGTIRNMHTDKSIKAVIIWEPGQINNPDPSLTINDGFTSDKPISLYGRSDLDAISRKAISTVNDAKRAELIKQEYKIVNEDLPSIPICSQTTVYIMKPNITYKPSVSINGAGSLLRDLTIK